MGDNERCVTLTLTSNRWLVSILCIFVSCPISVDTKVINIDVTLRWPINRTCPNCQEQKRHLKMGHKIGGASLQFMGLLRLPHTVLITWTLKKYATCEISFNHFDTDASLLCHWNLQLATWYEWSTNIFYKFGSECFRISFGWWVMLE